jgi:rod shape determining protein RodA
MIGHHSGGGFKSGWFTPRVILRHIVEPLDLPLVSIMVPILALGLLTLYSATIDMPARFNAQLLNILVGLSTMWVVARIPPGTLQRYAVPAFVLGLTLLILVAVAGEVVNGARRWLNLGITRIQPSEMMKIAMPLMLAWFFHQRGPSPGLRDFTIAGLLLVVPAALIMRQPDLGTAMLVLGAGFYVIFLAGLSWRVMLGAAVCGAGAAPFVWSMLHDYQRRRLLILLDPTQDPLGAGYHTIQSTIAVGSGGLFGKGWLHGTQAHLEFIPERHTDFIFAVFSEEFGLAGILLLSGLYLALIARCVVIASSATTLFSRLLGGSLVLTLATYALVNMGMVAGVLPVVGVPLPFISYGGTAMVTLCVAMGMMMSISAHRQLVSS